MQLARLIRTKAIWIDWKLERDSCDDFQRLLHRLVGASEAGIHTWLGTYHAVDGSTDRRRLVWTSGDETGPLIRGVYAQLTDCLARYPGDVLSGLNDAECQVLLDSTAISALVPDGVATDGHAFGDDVDLHAAEPTEPVLGGVHPDPRSARRARLGGEQGGP